MMDVVTVHDLGLKPYEPIWQAMRAFTKARKPDTKDEIWLLEHEAVYTQGQSGRAEHIKFAGVTPVVQSDRGGQVTYHGPGQVVIYPLLDISRAKMNIRQMVDWLEQSTIAFLAELGLTSVSDKQAPGVYIGGAKIASLGLRIHKGCSYHGIALNVAMDLAPFQQINPCGIPGLEVTQLANFVDITPPEAAHLLTIKMVTLLGRKMITGKAARL